MDLLKSWGITVCLAALSAGIAGIMAPAGKMEKTFKFVVSLFMLCCLLLPLLSFYNINLQCLQFKATNSAANSDLTKTVASQQEQMARQNISKLISDCCKSCGVTPRAVNVFLIKDKNNTYSVTAPEIVILHEDMAKQEKIKETVMKRLGIDIKIKEGGK